MRPHGLADRIRQDGPERRRGEHQRQRRVSAENNRNETSDDRASDNCRERIADPAESAAGAPMILGQRAQAPWTGGHRGVYRPARR